MRGWGICCLVLALGMFMIQGLPQAWAVSNNPQCVQDAWDDFKECVSTCRETFQVIKDLCRNISHDCAEQCRQSLMGCIGSHLEELGACKEDCEDARDQAVLQCRQQYQGNPPAMDDCIDTAQVQAFMCRDQCREQSQIRLHLRQCRQDFRSCIQACPAAIP